LAANAAEMIAQAAAGARLRVVELGAGSADKTRVLLKAATELQGAVVYEPVDVSVSALEWRGSNRTRDRRRYSDAACDGLHARQRAPIAPGPVDFRERRLVIYIGSSIGNFEPHQAAKAVAPRARGTPDGRRLSAGVDQAKDEATLLAAYDDAAGVTAAFNRNLLVRLNRELDAEFDPEAFAHCAVWNEAESRIEMHLKSRGAHAYRWARLA